MLFVRFSWLECNLTLRLWFMRCIRRQIHQDAVYTFSGFKNLESKETLLILSIISKLVDDSPTPMTLGKYFNILTIAQITKFILNQGQAAQAGREGPWLLKAVDREKYSSTATRGRVPRSTPGLIFAIVAFQTDKANFKIKQ